MATPFLNGPVAKRQLMDEIMSLLPNDFSEYETYVEPFLGGGSVMIDLERGFQGKVVAGDINKDIILCYRMIKQNHSALISELEAIQKEIPDDMDERKEFYKTIRDEWNAGVHQSIENSPKKQIRRAALTIGLNKMCFNGLFRLNSKGEFNVPMGGNLKVTIYSEEKYQTAEFTFQECRVHLWRLSNHFGLGRQ